LTILLVAVTSAVALAVPSAFACSAGSYTYAGVAGQTPVSGIGARITPAATGFNILAGHVAGWVGVGGPGQGPNGSDEWLQVGLSSFPGTTVNDIYYEVARPGLAPTYHRIAADVAFGSSFRVAVLETHARQSWWRVWVNGVAASPPIYLPQSHHRWPPIVTAESWDGGADTCNDFLYRFASLSIARVPGGVWSQIQPSQRIENADYSTVVDGASGAFYAAGGPFGLRTLSAAMAPPFPATTAP
jgi:hypothetical protein